MLNRYINVRQTRTEVDCTYAVTDGMPSDKFDDTTVLANFANVRSCLVSAVLVCTCTLHRRLDCLAILLNHFEQICLLKLDSVCRRRAGERAGECAHFSFWE